MQMDAGRGVEHDIADLYANHLRDPCPGVVEHGQQEMIALRSPGLTRLADHRQHLLARQEPEHRLLEPFQGHAQRLLDALQGGHVPACREFQESTQRHEPQIAGLHPIVTLLLQMIEERQDQVGRDVGQRQRGRGFAQALAGEIQKQHQGIAVGGDGVRAHGTLVDEVHREELLHQRRKRGGSRHLGLRHGRPPRRVAAARTVHPPVPATRARRTDTSRCCSPGRGRHRSTRPAWLGRCRRLGPARAPDGGR
jgi:hypothetical protein